MDDSNSGIQDLQDYYTQTRKFHNKADGLSRMALQKNPENPAWDAEEMEKEIPVMGITIGVLSEEFFQETANSYEGNSNTTKLV